MGNFGDKQVQNTAKKMNLEKANNLISARARQMKFSFLYLIWDFPFQVAVRQLSSLIALGADDRPITQGRQARPDILVRNLAA